MLDFVKTKLNINGKFVKMLVYFNSIINYSIWKMRNEIKFEFAIFSIEKLVSKIIRSMKARKIVDQKVIESKKIPHLIDLVSSFMNESKKYLPIDNG